MDLPLRVTEETVSGALSMEDPMQAARENVKRINVKTEIILRIDYNSRDR